MEKVVDIGSVGTGVAQGTVTTEQARLALLEFARIAVDGLDGEMRWKALVVVDAMTAFLNMAERGGDYGRDYGQDE